MCRQQPSDFRSIRAIETLLINSLVFQHNCHINLLYVRELRHRRRIRFREWTPRIIFFVAVAEITRAQRVPAADFGILQPQKITFLRVGVLGANVLLPESR